MRCFASILAATLLAGCITKGGSQIHIGSTYRGEGLYAPNCFNDPVTGNIGVVSSLEGSNIIVYVKITNGYKVPVVIRSPDRENFGLSDFNCYDQSGKIRFMGGGTSHSSSFPDYHRRFENLMGKSDSFGGEVDDLYWNTLCFTKKFPVRFVSDRAVDSGQAARSDTVFLPADTHTFDFRIDISLEYVVLSETGMHRHDLRVRSQITRTNECQRTTAGDSLKAASEK